MARREYRVRELEAPAWIESSSWARAVDALGDLVVGKLARTVELTCPTCGASRTEARVDPLEPGWSQLLSFLGMGPGDGEDDDDLWESDPDFWKEDDDGEGGADPVWLPEPDWRSCSSCEASP